MSNLEITDLLRSVAAAYVIRGKDKNKFKIVAYERAADSVEHLSSEAKDLWDEKKLTLVSGIGESIAGHIGEIFTTGKSTHFTKIFKGIKPATFDLIKISGVGPKTAHILSTKLNISDKRPFDDLLKKSKNNEVENIEGFGEDSQTAIIKSIKELKGRKRRMLLNYAEETAESVVSWMKKSPDVVRAEVLGSLRRKLSTIGDIDIAASTINAKSVLKHFTKYPKLNRTIEIGKKTASIMLPGDIQVDLIVQESNSYGTLLQHFTGSKHHNIALREYALKKRMSLSENGIKENNKLIIFNSEVKFYEHLGLKYIPPELREDRGEIEAAKNNTLPNLLELGDIKSDLQIHSSFDIETSHDLGENTMKEIIMESDKLGYEYIAFTEHNPSHSKHKNSEIIELIKRKSNAVKVLNENFIKNKCSFLKSVFNSLEIDILPDGNIPVPEEALNLLDFALVSIHSSFKQTRKQMTKRVLSALEHPKVKIFAHPTARKLGFREGIELEWENIIDLCKRKNKWIEINADPMRLDLPDFLVKDAVKSGVKLTLGTDSHTTQTLKNMKYGVYVARKGWAQKRDIVNTKGLNEFVKMLEL